MYKECNTSEINMIVAMLSKFSLYCGSTKIGEQEILAKLANLKKSPIFPARQSLLFNVHVV